MSTYQADLRSVLAELRLSPTFAMSLGAKELFHSNFLAFLLESREPELSALQTELRLVFGCPRSDDEESWCFVYRELHSLDLVIVPVRGVYSPGDDAEVGSEAERAFIPSGSPCAVIEMKLKSLPTVEQLSRYSQLLQKGAKYRWEDANGKEHAQVISPDPRHGKPAISLCLLTVDAQAVQDDQCDALKWKALGWEAVARTVRDFVEGNRGLELGGNLRSVLADYAESLLRVLGVVRRTRELYRESATRPYLEFLSDIVKYPELRAARLVDLAGKRAFAEWIDEVMAEVRGLRNAPGQCHGEAFLTRGTPGLTVEWRFKRQFPSNDLTLRIGVQVQGLSYRHFVAVQPGWNGLEGFIVDSGLLGSWFTGKVAQLPDSTELMATRVGHRTPEVPNLCSNHKRRTNLRKFEVAAFLYSAADLNDKQATLGRVTQAIVASMQQAAGLVAQLRA